MKTEIDIEVIDENIQSLELDIMQISKKIARLRRQRPPEECKTYEFKSIHETKTLLDLFGDKDELMIIHNMGVSCPYCTLWADGFNGIADHLQNRSAFILTSPDSPETLHKFAQSRSWKFPYYSVENSDFSKDMGFNSEAGEHVGSLPGVSTFRRDGDKVFRYARADFGPGDLFCSLWHLLSLLPNGENNWQPKYFYHSETEVANNTQDIGPG